MFSLYRYSPTFNSKMESSGKLQATTEKEKSGKDTSDLHA